MVTFTTDTIDKLMGEVQKLQRGCQILEDIYLFSDDRVIPEDIFYKMRDYFGYDDSE